VLCIFSLPDGINGINVKNTMLGHIKTMIVWVASSGTFGALAPAAAAMPVPLAPAGAAHAAHNAIDYESHPTAATAGAAPRSSTTATNATGENPGGRGLAADATAANNVPSSVWLLSAGLMGLGGLARQRRVENRH